MKRRENHKQTCPRPHYHRPEPRPARRRSQRTYHAVLLALIGLVVTVHGAGTLQPARSQDQPIRITDHAVSVVINNGFAITSVTQTFENPNPVSLEAIYRFPLPKRACLSEVQIHMGENVINGEVLAREKARQVYEEEKRAGNDAGLASTEGYKEMQFRVVPVRPNVPVVIKFVYYEQITLDTNVGRYLYPLENGGTDDPQAISFWTRNEQVEGTFSFDLELKSAWPVADVRLAGLESATNSQKIGEGHWKVSFKQNGAALIRDLVFYYRLVDNLPGRVEVIAHREDRSKPGTFMMVVTPGVDLKPLTGGADYAFLLDTSGSMASKLGALAEGVAQTLGKLNPQDRFRVVEFNSHASAVTANAWTPATPEAVQDAINKVRALQSKGSTNLYEGINTVVRSLDDDRATSLVLVTDAVANAGEIHPKAFARLLEQVDMRVFGFLLGNSSNWPLMDLICDTSGGFYAPVSNSDDIIGQILLAKSKVLHECMHDATLEVRGTRVRDTTDTAFGKVYRGQQLVFLGRYDKPGPATVTLKARLTGQDKEYTTTFDFPEIATENPELERLWALDRIESIERQRDRALIPECEALDAIRDLGVEYQIVTDETSMVVLSDARFAARKIKRRNRERLAKEHAAQQQRAAAPAVNRRVDRKKPAFKMPAPSIGGGGALDPLTVIGMLLVAFGAVQVCRRKND